jgi:hypothetical protein
LSFTYKNEIKKLHIHNLGYVICFSLQRTTRPRGQRNTQADRAVETDQGQKSGTDADLYAGLGNINILRLN